MTEDQSLSGDEVDMTCLAGSTLEDVRTSRGPQVTEAVRLVLQQVERPRTNLGGAGPPGRVDSGHHASAKQITLAESDFRELATGGGSPQVVDRLWKVDHSRRLVLLRALVEAAVDESGSSNSTLTEAWSALEAAERRSPGAIATLIMHPQVSAWLAYALRRHRGGATSSAPADHDFAQLGALAIAAAALAGQTFRTTVPLRGGHVMIPPFGMARFEGCPDWDVAEASTEGGRIWLRYGDQQVTVPTGQADGPGWWALRRVTVGDELTLTVWLDDLDPWRDLADPVGPARLSAEHFERWSSLLDGAWRILVDNHRSLAEALTVGVRSLVPLPAGDGWGTRSASTSDAFGAIMCSPPPDATTLAVSLVHEFTHIKLGGLMHLFTMTEGASRPILYAPWRDDPRPNSGLLQGIYAFFAIADFWRRERLVRRGALQDFEYAYARTQTREALDIALRDGALSDRGRRFAEGLRDAMRDWDVEDVDPVSAELAALVTDAHRAGWRIRHCRPRPADVEALVRALENGSSTDYRIGPSEVLPDPEMRHWSAGRLGLARRRLLAPARYADARHEDWGTPLTEGDLSLFDGDPAKAVSHFTEEIAANPESPDAWVGLGLALSAEGSRARAGQALLTRPEIVLAVHRASRTARSPIDLADWTGQFIDHSAH